MELNDNGNSFVFQLKNGNFIINDGGQEIDAPYLVDYIESLTPEGKKPVIEAWFITHAHSDHFGAIWKIASDMTLKDRLIVNGVYFTEPNINAAAWAINPLQYLMNCRMVSNAFKTEDGSITPMFRPQIGQKYYFCDIVIDVLLTAEQLPFCSYNSDDLNDTSIWLMHHIEGQKVLIAGDANNIAMRKVMELYDSEYFDLDVMAVFHHGINVYDYFTEFVSVKTLLYTIYRAGSMYTDGSWREAKEANLNLQNAVKEFYHRGDGTVVLTFPYNVGDAVILPPLDWKYNPTPGKPEREEL